MDREELIAVYDANAVNALTAEINAVQAQLQTVAMLPDAVFAGGQAEKMAEIRNLRAALTAKTSELEDIRKAASAGRQRISGSDPDKEPARETAL